MVSKKKKWLAIQQDNTPVPFNPSQITTTLWLDSTDSSTLTDDGAGLISQWRDKSGNNNHANGVTTGRPTLTLAVQNGLNVLRFSPPNSLEIVNRLTLTGEYTIFTVLSRRVITGTRIFIGDSLTDAKLGHTVPSTQRFFARSLSAGSNDQTIVYPTAINVFGLISVQRDASNKVDYQFNNTSAVRLYADASQSGTTGVRRIGNDNAGTAGWNGDIAEVIVIDGNVSSALKTQINNYLITKYNL